MTQKRCSRSFASIPLTVVALALAVSQTGCPQGAELEHPEQYPQLTSSTGGSSNGAAGSSSGGMGIGGMTGVTLTSDDVGCDIVSVIGDDTKAHRGSCAYNGCHGLPTLSSNLNLAIDSGLVSRLKDVPAKHGDLLCPTDADPFAVCDPPPASCPDALLVDSANPDASWILQKINGTQGDCGTQMPDGLFSDDKKACVDKLVRYIAALP